VPQVRKCIILQLNFKLYKEDNLVLEENNISYEKEEDRIIFQIQEMNHIIDLHQKTLERFNEEFHFYLNFAKEECTYELKSHQAIFDIAVDQSFFEIKEKGLEIMYAIETDDYKNKILIDFLN